MSELSIPTYDPATTVRSLEVEIDAPASVVWEVLTDLDSYPHWNPFCVAAKSTLELGAAVEMTLADYSGATETFPYTEYVCAVVPERLLSWELRPTEVSVQAARRDQVIEPITDNRCRYYSTDAFLGEEALQIMADSGEWVKRAFDDTAVALKERSEALFTERRPDPRSA
ncbi:MULTISPECIES: SRPBCC domain-containing protein [unclassified Rhodococcus (in: high G+C Gram-positive bacteria)]|uniref:SRPBCC domain-containing protein n=1 Tax=unclassified Rhodococcus (in: high G+C Gram-positive bacteria) TaxID=192944 RepID=UPI00146A5097|nr:SRPBCC domain-containing protein [Rhodococcus sp. BL-253-APC-6A1W]NMD96779.1 SRPBCC domain-containing protein [Rhodococcus sp. BL-253-APC-6A1W]